jgi:hypothetical protein
LDISIVANCSHFFFFFSATLAKGRCHGFDVQSLVAATALSFFPTLFPPTLRADLALPSRFWAQWDALLQAASAASPDARPSCTEVGTRNHEVPELQTTSAPSPLPITPAPAYFKTTSYAGHAHLWSDGQNHRR